MEDAAGAAASPASRAEQDPLPGGMPGALQLMQRRLGSTDPGSSAAALPAPVQAAQVLGPRPTAATGAIAAAASPQYNAAIDQSQPPPPLPAVTAKRKWRSFMQGPLAASESPQPAQQQVQVQQPQPQLDKPKAQGQQDIRTSLSQWQPQRAGMHLPRVSTVSPAAGLTTNSRAMRPSSSIPAPALQPGGLFAHFALGSSSLAAAPGMQASVRQPAVAAASPLPLPQPAALLGSWAGAKSGASAASADQENEPAAGGISKRRKLSSLLPLSSQLGLAPRPELPPVGPPLRAAEAAADPMPRKPLLPRLAWLSGRFSGPAAAPAPAMLEAAVSTARPPDVLPHAQASLQAAAQHSPPVGVPSIGVGVFDFL